MSLVISNSLQTAQYTELPEPLYRDEQHIYMPKNNHAWSGLVYLESGKAVSAYTVEPEVGNVHILYMMAVSAALKVSQGKAVHIFHLGYEWGVLQGLG